MTHLPLTWARFNRGRGEVESLPPERGKVRMGATTAGGSNVTQRRKESP